MKGFKVIAEDKTHHGFVYQEGLNIDPNPFQPEGSCVAGGLYFFTDIKDLYKWLSYGVYLYEVEVPNGRRYVKDPSGNKYRSKYLILSNPLDLREVTTWEYLIKKVDNSPAIKGYALRWSAEYGHIEVVKYLVGNGVNIHAYNDYALRMSAENGHLKIVEYLVEQGADIHAKEEYALCLSACSGHLNVVKYLVGLGVNIHAREGEALRLAAHSGHLEVVRYLQNL